MLGDHGRAERHGSLDLGDTVRTRRDVEMDSVLPWRRVVDLLEAEIVDGDAGSRPRLSSRTDVRRLIGRSLDSEQGRSDDAAVVEQACGHDRCLEVQERQELVGLPADAAADHEQVGGEDELHVLVERL